MRFAYPSPLVVVSLPQCWLLFLWDALHDDKRHDVWEISCTLSRSLSVSLSLPLWPLIFSTFYREMHSKWFRTMAVRETEAGERQRGREGREIGLVMSWSLWGKGVAVSHCCHCCCCCCCLLSFHFLFDSKPFWICFYICPVVVVVVNVVSLAIHKRAAAPHELLQQMRVGGVCCCYHFGCNVHCSHW